MKFKYIPMLFLAASLGLASCDDYLDKEPESDVTPAGYRQPGCHWLLKPLGARQLEGRLNWR